jgi:hypothetical protein
MSSLAEIEEAIERLPDSDLHRLATWLERRKASKPAPPVQPRDPDFLERARRIWGDRPTGEPLSELVARQRG